MEDLSIIDEIQKWAEEKEVEYSFPAAQAKGVACTHYLCETSPAPGRNGFEEWMNGYCKWIENRWKDEAAKNWRVGLEKKYGIAMCGIHYRPTVCLHRILLTAPIMNIQEYEKEVKGYRDTFLKIPSYHHKHFAYRMIEENLGGRLHFRISTQDSQKNDFQKGVIHISRGLFGFLVSRFKPCHLSETIADIGGSLGAGSTWKQNLDVIKQRCIESNILHDTDSFEEFLQSLMLSFYVSLSLEKAATRMDKTVLFKDNGAVDALFIGVKMGNRVGAVIPSLHTGKITTEQAEELEEIYTKVLLKFMTWEKLATEDPAVAEKLKEPQRTVLQELASIKEKLENLPGLIDADPGTAKSSAKLCLDGINRIKGSAK